MSKMDCVGARTPADIERKYNFKQSFSEVMGISTDARNIAEEVQETGGGMAAEFTLTTENAGTENEHKLYSLLAGSGAKIKFEANSFIVNSTFFTVAEDGTVNISGGQIGGCSFDGEGNLIVPASFIAGTIGGENVTAENLTATNITILGTSSFGNAHITSEGAFVGGRKYDGFYLGDDDTDTFFGVNDTGSHVYLALGLNRGGVLLSEEGIIYENNEVITWAELLSAVKGKSPA